MKAILIFDILTSVIEVIAIALIIAGIWLLLGFQYGLIATGLGILFISYSLSNGLTESIDEPN